MEFDLAQQQTYALPFVAFNFNLTRMGIRVIFELDGFSKTHFGSVALHARNIGRPHSLKCAGTRMLLFPSFFRNISFLFNVVTLGF